MNSLVMWFFGAWTAFFVGAVLATIGFDAWLSYRREQVREQQK